jgi:glycosyltransferase involved in cell wall biosynthesis
MPSQMKIVLCISSICGGGAERAMSLLANHWAGRGDDVVLVTFQRSPRDYPLDPRVERVCLEMSDVSRGFLDATSNNWRRLRALRTVLRASNASVAVSFEDRMNSLVLLAATGTGIRCVVSERTDPRRHAIGRVWGALRRVTYPFTDALVVQTEAVRGWGAGIVLDRSRVHAIPNPVRCMRAFRRSDSGAAYRTVVAVGRLIPAKGFDLLLRAFASIADKSPDWRVVIAGEGPERAKLLALADSLGIAGRVTLTGWLEEPGYLLTSAGVYVLPSRYEGFPNALLEAMACGVPVIATACTGASEIVTDGVDGVLVPVDSHVELARALRRLMQDDGLRARLAQCAQAVSERYKMDAVSRRWDEIMAAPAERPRAGLSHTPRKATNGPTTVDAAPPSIVFLTRDLDIGGAQRQMVDLAAGLQRCGWKVKVASFYAGGALEGELAGAGVPLICLNKSGRWDMAGFLWRLLRLLRRERPDIAHGLLGVPNILLSLLKPVLGDTRVVWGIAASNMDLSQYDWLMRLEFRVSIALSRCADLMISNSRAGLDYHAARGYPPERIIVIPNGVDVQRFRPDAEARRRLRSEWGVAPDEKLVGVVGRLDPMKDHRNFLRAAARVAAVRPAARFVCIGDGPSAFRLELEALARQLGLDRCLLWAGTREDICDVYNAFDVKVSSSISEGLSNAVAEAMATGVPCVVTDVGDSAEVVDGLGWVCPPDDSAALSTAILHALESLPCDGTRIRQRICANYSAQARLDRTAGELARVMEAGKACLGRV